MGGMPLLPAVCVLVRRASDGHYLFIERAPGRFAPGYWTPVTGRVEPGESLVAAAAREVLEETGLRVTIGAELGKTGTDLPGGGSAGYELTWFDATLSQDTTVVPQSAEVARARWVTIDEALELSPLFPTTRRFLEDHRRAR
jgi:8-oxo-dGTP pyrophosphatase MutT (NUDIX family)